MIPREIAEGILGIPVTTLPMESINSVGNQFQVGVAEVLLTIEQRGIRESLTMPVQIPMNCPGYPVLPLLGREPLFHHFDIQFRMDYTTALGKFTLRKVVKHRDPENYNVGGRPLKGRR